jgi:hypothetical protein
VSSLCNRNCKQAGLVVVHLIKLCILYVHAVLSTLLWHVPLLPAAMPANIALIRRTLCSNSWIAERVALYGTGTSPGLLSAETGWLSPGSKGGSKDVSLPRA